MNAMQYKGYTGVVEYDAEDRIFHGRVVDLADLVSFEGATVDELEQDFHAAVDDYLVFCEERGRAPAKPYSGRLNLRMPPDMHRRLAVDAERRGKSLNDRILEALERDLSQGLTAA